MEPLEQQQREQSCPNLNAQGVLARADEGLDLEVLLERLEEQLDLPAFTIDVGQGCGPEAEMVGQDLDLALLLGVPDDDAPQRIGARVRGGGGAQPDDLVGQD